MEQRGRNGWQTFGRVRAQKWLELVKTVATSCHCLLGRQHGKEGVDGSSPSEGSAKVQHVAAFAFSPTCRVGSVRWVWSRLWSFRVQNGVAQRHAWPTREADLGSFNPKVAGSIPARPIHRNAVRAKPHD
jgi:hypothetical protein